MLIENPEVTVPELMTVIKGPDFPTGAHIIGTAGAKSAFMTGRGSIRIRAVVEIQDLKKDAAIILTTHSMEVIKLLGMKKNKQTNCFQRKQMSLETELQS